MRTLYHQPLSPFSRKVRVVLREKISIAGWRLKKCGSGGRNSSPSIPPAPCRC